MYKYTTYNRQNKIKTKRTKQNKIAKPISVPNSIPNIYNPDFYNGRARNKNRGLRSAEARTRRMKQKRVKRNTQRKNHRLAKQIALQSPFRARETPELKHRTERNRKAQTYKNLIKTQQFKNPENSEPTLANISGENNRDTHVQAQPPRIYKNLQKHASAKLKHNFTEALKIIKHFNLSSTNVRGINDGAKRNMYDSWGHENHITIMFLEETKINQNKAVETDHYIWYFGTGVPIETVDKIRKLKESKTPIPEDLRLSSTEHWGTGFAIHKSLVPALDQIFIINKRISVAYAPTAEASEHDKDTFYTDLDKVVNDIPNEAILVIGGDFNARIICRSEHLTEHIGEHFLKADENEVNNISPQVEDNRIRFFKFLQKHDLWVANAHFENSQNIIAHLNLPPPSEQAKIGDMGHFSNTITSFLNNVGKTYAKMQKHMWIWYLDPITTLFGAPFMLNSPNPKSPQTNKPSLNSL